MVTGEELISSHRLCVCLCGPTRSGGGCYRSCRGRLLITGEMTGSITSYSAPLDSDTTAAHCQLVIIASKEKLPSNSTSASLQQAVDPGLAVILRVDSIGESCPGKAALIYDGLVPFLLPTDNVTNLTWPSVLASVSQLYPTGNVVVSLTGILTLIVPFSTVSAKSAISVSFRVAPCQGGSCVHSPCWFLPPSLPGLAVGYSPFNGSLLCSGSSSLSETSTGSLCSSQGCIDNAVCTPVSQSAFCLSVILG